MLYIDSNIFVYAHIDAGELGERARKKLRDARDGPGVCTSALTLDEVMWSVQKTKGRTRKDVEEVARKFLRLDRLKILPVEQRDLSNVVEHYKNGLDPRDAIHVAVALRHNCEAILSSDPDIAKAKGIAHHAFP